MVVVAAAVHALIPPSTWEAEVGQISVSLRPAWSTELVPRQPELIHRETLSRKTKQKKKSSGMKTLSTKQKRPIPYAKAQSMVFILRPSQ